MMDKIKAEADAIPCGKDEKIKALEALLKMAIKERDEAMAHGERLRDAAHELSLGLIHDEPEWIPSEYTDEAFSSLQDALSEQPQAALAALKAEWQAEVVESFLHGLSSSDTINIHNRRPDARVEWFSQRAQEAGE